MSESPPAITALRPTRRDPSRATVRVGRKVVATLDCKHIDALDLHVGQPWTEELSERVQSVADYDHAMRKALQRLRRRPMSRAELDRKLRQIEIAPQVRANVLDEFTRQGELNDEIVGRMLLNDLLLRKPAGPRLLRQKLIQKGIPNHLIEPLVQQALESTEPVDDALTLLRKKLPAVRQLDPIKRKRRLLGLLQRRGFDLDTIQQAMRRVDDELEP